MRQLHEAAGMWRLSGAGGEGAAVQGGVKCDQVHKCTCVGRGVSLMHW